MKRRSCSGTGVWCILPDNTLLMTSWKILLRAPTWSITVLIWIQAELFCYSQTSCYHLPRLSPTSEAASFPENFLLSLQKSSLRNCITPPFSEMISLVLSLKSVSYLKEDIACLAAEHFKVMNSMRVHWATKMCKVLCFMFA